MTESQVTRTEIVAHIEHVFGTRALAREDLVLEAKLTSARPDVISALRKLPNDRPYTHIRDLWAHLSEIPV